MKFSFSTQLQTFVLTDLGELIDSDDDLNALLERNGMLSDDDESEESESEESDD